MGHIGGIEPRRGKTAKRQIDVESDGQRHGKVESTRGAHLRKSSAKLSSEEVSWEIRKRDVIVHARENTFIASWAHSCQGVVILHWGLVLVVEVQEALPLVRLVWQELQERPWLAMQ